MDPYGFDKFDILIFWDFLFFVSMFLPEQTKIFDTSPVFEVGELQ